MRRSALLAPFALVSLLGLARALPPGPDKKETAEIKQKMGEAAARHDWAEVADHLLRLADSNDVATWKFLLKVSEKAPEESPVPRAIKEAAEKMTSASVQKEVEKSATEAKSAEVRRYLIGHLAKQEKWPTLIKAINDPNEEVASLAAWKLVDARVEEAVDPLIAAMEKRDGKQDGIWDVLRNGLGKLLGQRLGSAAEYRSVWTMVKADGGLSAVKPKAVEVEGGGGTMVRLFGREIECKRVVFILDCSGSMETIDPTQEDPLAGSFSRTRKPPPGPTNAPEEKPRGKTRMERAQIALKEMLKRLPPDFKINLVAYDTDVRVWRSSDEPGQPYPLVDMNEKNRQDAIEWMDKQRASGVTVTDDAIARAFDIKGARCFYVLSDGFVTHDGQTQIPTEQILQMIRRNNAERHVIIHTMGFEGADREMMQAVAEAAGGKYSDIR